MGDKSIEDDICGHLVQVIVTKVAAARRRQYKQVVASRVEVLRQEMASGVLQRNVILEGKRTTRPVEYGTSRIRLDTLEQSVRVDVILGQVPLGGILNALGVCYDSCPGGFFRVRPEGRIAEALDLDAASAPDWLYGRCNCLKYQTGGTIAEVVEILPPEKIRSRKV